MSCRVAPLVLALMLVARGAAQDYSLTTDVVNVILSAESTVTSQPAMSEPNPALPLVDSLRRQLMYNNYDYVLRHAEDRPTEEQAGGDPPTRTAMQPAATAATLVANRTDVPLGRSASHSDLNQQSQVNTAPDSHLTQHQLSQNQESSVSATQSASPDGATSTSLAPGTRGTVVGGPASVGEDTAHPPLQATTPPPHWGPAPLPPRGPAPLLPRSPASLPPRSPAPLLPRSPASLPPRSPAPLLPRSPASLPPRSPTPLLRRSPASLPPQRPAPVLPRSPASLPPQRPAPVLLWSPASLPPQGPAPLLPRSPASLPPQRPAPVLLWSPASLPPQGPAPLLPRAPASPPPQGPTTTSPSELELYLQGSYHTLTNANQRPLALNRDLLYYINDDLLKSGVNFRRYNDDRVNEKGEPFSSSEHRTLMPMEPTTKRHKHRRRRARRRHMRREDLYIGRRHNKGRASEHSSAEHASGQRDRLHGSILVRRRSRPHHHASRVYHRRARVNQLPQGYRKHMPTNVEDIEEIPVNRAPVVKPNHKMYGHDTLSDEDHDYHQMHPHEGGYDEEHSPNKDSGEVQDEQHYDLEYNKLEEPGTHTNAEQVSTLADGRRNYEHEVTPQNVTETSQEYHYINSSLNASTVALPKTNKYKLLEAGHGRGGRRSGGGVRLVQERGGAGVRLVALDGPHFPQFRLPRMRRQYMQERVTFKNPLARLLPRRTSSAYGAATTLYHSS